MYLPEKDIDLTENIETLRIAEASGLQKPYTESELYGLICARDMTLYPIQKFRESYAGQSKGPEA